MVNQERLLRARADRDTRLTLHRLITDGGAAAASERARPPCAGLRLGETLPGDLGENLVSVAARRLHRVGLPLLLRGDRRLRLADLPPQAGSPPLQPLHRRRVALVITGPHPGNVERGDPPAA